jgi:uncharacterized Zn-binding protein involved in type VI secretion
MIISDGPHFHLTAMAVRGQVNLASSWGGVAPLVVSIHNKTGNGMRPFIVIGDQTDHGGLVVGSTQTTDTFGKRFARVGDQVTCPKNGHGTTVIVTRDPTMIVDGAPVARHGDKCALGGTSRQLYDRPA